jgi:hypothetical protein
VGFVFEASCCTRCRALAPEPASSTAATMAFGSAPPSPVTCSVSRSAVASVTPPPSSASATVCSPRPQVVPPAVGVLDVVFQSPPWLTFSVGPRKPNHPWHSIVLPQGRASETITFECSAPLGFCLRTVCISLVSSWCLKDNCIEGGPRLV